MAPDRHPRCPGAPPAKVRGHPTPIAPATGGERFSPTRFSLTGADPAAETTRRGLCAAPPSEKRYTLSVVSNSLAAFFSNLLGLLNSSAACFWLKSVSH